MTQQHSEAIGETTGKTTVMTRLLQAAMLTLLLQLMAQLYPSALTQTTAVQLQEASDAFLAWDSPEPGQTQLQVR